MAVPVIFSTGSLYPFGLETIYAWISETGYDGVEIMMGERWDTHQEDYLRGLHERHGVPILSLHPPLRRGAWGLGPEETLVRVARLASRMEVPGKGRLPLRPFPAALGASGYTDAVSLELKPWQLGTPDPEAILERMRAARQFTRDGLDAI